MAQDKVLRAVMHADVRVIDPIWTTQTIANIHGALVYDTLFGNDADQKPQPQMVGKYEISPDRLTYTFTLRDGLEFHDGSPVTTKDVIASLKRWGAKDGVGPAPAGLCHCARGGRRQDLKDGAAQALRHGAGIRSARRRQLDRRDHAREGTHTAITRVSRQQPILNPYPSGHRAVRRTTSPRPVLMIARNVLQVLGLAASTPRGCCTTVATRGRRG